MGGARWLAVAVVFVAVGAVLLWRVSGAAVPASGVGRVEHAAEHRVAVARGQVSDGALANAGTQREHVVVSGPTSAPVPDPETWRLRLVGIEPNAPWTTPLQLTFWSSQTRECEVDELGECRFRRPTSPRTEGRQFAEVHAADSNYRLRTTRLPVEALLEHGIAEIDVLPVARLAGTVEGPGDLAIVRLRAWQLDADGPRPPLLGRASADAEGRYVLHVPPGIPLLVVADSWDGAVEGAAALPSLGRPRSLEDLANGDAWQFCERLVPPSAVVEGVLGQTRQVPTLRFEPTVELAGVVSCENGRPLAGVTVVATPRSAPRSDLGLHWSPSLGIAPGASVTADDEGRFTLPVRAGVQYTVMATAEDPLMLAGEPTVTATAPAHVDLIAPGELVELRVVADGAPVPGARVEMGPIAMRADGDGSLRVTFGAEPVRLRASSGLRASDWQTRVPGASTMALELPRLEASQVRVRLHSEGPSLFAANFDWRRDDGLRATMRASREHVDEPFGMQVPVGRYSLRVRDVSGHGFLLPMEHTVEVPPGGRELSVRIEWGGRIELHVEDQAGVPCLGSFALTDAAGADVTPGTIAENATHGLRVGRPGELLSLGPNRVDRALLPGRYRLDLDVEGRGRTTRDIEVRAREVTIVEVRL